MNRSKLLAGLLTLLVLSGCQPRSGRSSGAPFSLFRMGPDPLALVENPSSPAERIVNGAKREVLRGVIYDASYRTLAYPGGDVPADRGACTDVVIRALREAGYDLQKLVHQDMRARFTAYPKHYGLRRPDWNIDHRRCANLMVFFRRYGRELPRSLTGAAARTWKAGDLVFVRLPGGLLHTGVCSNVRGSSGLPLVIHNMSQAAQEDVLDRWDIIGHFRYPVP